MKKRKRMNSNGARILSDPNSAYPVIRYDEVDELIYRAAKDGKNILTIEEKYIRPVTVKKLQRLGFSVQDHCAAAYIQAGPTGLDCKGHWTICW